MRGGWSSAEEAWIRDVRGDAGFEDFVSMVWRPAFDELFNFP